MSITVDSSAAVDTETQSGSTMTVSETPMSADSSRVQLRPVGFPSPVTQLFDYILHAWDYQKGDHCAYKYVLFLSCVCMCQLGTFLRENRIWR